MTGFAGPVPNGAARGLPLAAPRPFHHHTKEGHMAEKKKIEKNPKKGPVVIRVQPEKKSITLSKYHHGICGIDLDRSDALGTRVTTDTKVDVYDVLLAFGVTCPARQHAIKKLLAAGVRGNKETAQDLEEARQSVVRAQELLQDYGSLMTGTKL